MKLTIDTKTDTHDDIRKVLHILTNILERKGESVNSFNQTNNTNNANNTNNQTDTTNMMSMFSDNSFKAEPADTPPDFSSFLNLGRKEEEEKKEPKIEFF